MNCLECRGACCEEFSLPVASVIFPGLDEKHWLELHGDNEDGCIRFECRCTKLTSEGKCGIYETRPIVCHQYVAGGIDCLDVVRRRRTPEQYQEIRDLDDPEIIHN